MSGQQSPCMLTHSYSRRGKVTKKRKLIKTFCLIVTGGSVDDYINQVKIELKPECCIYNRLYINWAKKFIMFIINKTVV